MHKVTIEEPVKGEEIIINEKKKQDGTLTQSNERHFHETLSLSASHASATPGTPDLILNQLLEKEGSSKGESGFIRRGSPS